MSDDDHICPKCGDDLWHQVGEDDFSGDVLLPYDRLVCTNRACDFGWCDTEDFEEIRGGSSLSPDVGAVFRP